MGNPYPIIKITKMPLKWKPQHFPGAFPSLTFPRKFLGLLRITTFAFNLIQSPKPWNTDQFCISSGSFLSHCTTIIFFFFLFYTKALSTILILESSSSIEQSLFLSVAFPLRRCRNGKEVHERECASLAVQRAGCAIGVHSPLRRSAASRRSPLLRSPLQSHLRHWQRA